MPTYDYKCNDCNESLEQFHGMNDSPEVPCPSCGTIANKMIGMGAGVHYKGSGFYTTDYKNAAPAKSESPVKSEAPKTCGAGGNCVHAQ